MLTRGEPSDGTLGRGTCTFLSAALALSWAAPVMAENAASVKASPPPAVQEGRAPLGEGFFSEKVVRLESVIVALEAQVTELQGQVAELEKSRSKLKAQLEESREPAGESWEFDREVQIAAESGSRPAEHIAALEADRIALEEKLSESRRNEDQARRRIAVLEAGRRELEGLVEEYRSRTDILDTALADRSRSLEELRTVVERLRAAEGEGAAAEGELQDLHRLREEDSLRITAMEAEGERLRELNRRVARRLKESTMRLLELERRLQGRK